MTTTDIVPAAPAPETGTLDLHRPDLEDWARKLQAAHQIGTALCGTSFAPQHFRGKPDEAAAAILYGSEVGFTPTQALQNLYVIGGKPALYSRPMVAIVQAAGHEVWTVEKSDESVTVAGRRRGSEHVIQETWTVQRAQRAGYTTNKKYQTDPQAMLYARAASDVCRQIAADALAGMAYSVEELEMTPSEAPRLARGIEGLRAAVQAPSGPDDGLTNAQDITDAEEVPADEPRPLTAHTRKKMFALLGDVAPDSTPEQQRHDMGLVLGREIKSRSELTEDDAQAVVDALQAEKRRREIAAETAGGE